MANDRNVKIGIETTANTTGADKAVEAIDEVVDKGQEAGKAIDEAGKGPGLKKVPAEAKAAAGSIDALEEEVTRLNRELNKLPVGSTEFVEMAAKVKVATREMRDAEVVATRLGSTIGRKGNAGGAVLEFSRAFEDAQYGIRGVLNNIPGLIAMLGGGAGLAGVVSIAAVAGTQLWERFGQGAKNAEKDTGNVLTTFDQLRKVYREIEALGKEEREKVAKDQAEGVKKSLEGNAARFKLDVDAGALDAAREKAAAVLQLAKDKLELSRVEAALLTATGEKSVQLAKDREAIIRKIYQDEIAIAEVQRKQALTTAGNKVDTAGNNVNTLGQARADLNAQYGALRATVEGLLAEADELEASRTFAAQQLNSEREALIAKIKTIEQDIIDRPNITEVDDRTFEISQAEQMLASLAKLIADPGTTRQESDLRARAEEKAPEISAIKEQLDESTKAQDQAAKAMTEATLALRNLREAQGIERGSESNLKGVADQQKKDQDAERFKVQTVGSLTGLLDAVGETGGKDLAPFVTELKAILQDKALSADELARLPVLMSQYFAKIANLGTAQNETVRAAMSRVDELEREVRNLKSTAGSRNP